MNTPYAIPASVTARIARLPDFANGRDQSPLEGIVPIRYAHL